MQVETSREAVGERIDELLGWLTGPDSGQNDGITETVRVLRAILSERDAATARAEAAERERDAFKRNMEAAADLAARYGSERDAATAERDKMKAALEKAAIAAEVESAGHAIAIIEAALTSAKEAGE